MTGREGCIALNMISGIGFVKYSALVGRFGSPEKVFSASFDELCEVPKIGEQLAGKISSFDLDVLFQELSLCERCGVRVMTLLDETYPAILRQLYDPPLALYVKGRLNLSFEKTISIVGTRRLSGYGARMTKQLADEAASRGFVIVSGLALGADTIAHTSAVEYGMPTVAVLGGGLMCLHPRENITLAHKIVECGGAVISEFPLRFPVARQTFPRRNRIVAGLSRGVIVVEAGEKSGALITAKQALDLGREIFAVPGHADNPQAHGCHLLIKQGAMLIENFGDVASTFGCNLLPGLDAADEDKERIPPPHGSDLSANEQLILEVLDNGDASLEELSAALPQLDIGALLSALMKLEMKMLIQQGAEKRYILSTEPGAWRK